MQTIDRYFLGELLPPFVLNIFFFTLLFLITKLPEISDLIVNYQVSILSVFRLLSYSAPLFMQFTIPMSVMVSVMITFLRFSGDMEITALKAGGYSLWRFLPSVSFFCLLAAALTLLVTVYGIPWGKVGAKQLLIDLSSQHGRMAVKPMVFNDLFADITLYAAEIDRETGELTDVFIEDLRAEEGLGTITAPRGRIHTNPEDGSAILRLSDGMILREEGGGGVHAISFKRYDLMLDFAENTSSIRIKKNDEDEMSLSEFRNYLSKEAKDTSAYREVLIAFHEKFSLPVACMVLGFLALGLGVRPMARKSQAGMAVGLFYFVLYYALLTMGRTFGESGVLPPAFAVWTPNILLFMAGSWLFIRLVSEKPAIPEKVILFFKIGAGE
ncbi:LPS export ABC transporter permease LptF [Desulfococcaceae bacterium OttesenSCG-928-F15]|nr:LPS export ABC transporter permease LptF [Desulfococcaceae bacterium OttesenSCG-928-F15]